MISTVGNTLNKLGILIMIIGFISGFIVASDDDLGFIFNSEFIFPLALACWVNSFLAGMFLIGFAKVIDLLEKQNSYSRETNNLNRSLLEEVKQLHKASSSDSTGTRTNQGVNSKESANINDKVELVRLEKRVPISEENKQKITKHYPRKVKVNDVISTPFDKVFLAECADGQHDFIRFSGFLPFLISEKGNEGLSEWLNTYLSAK